MSDKTDEVSGSFCIPQRALDLLLRGYPEKYLDKGNVEERFTFIEVSVICAYLVIANFTGPEGVKSTAGVQALEKYLQCGKVFVERQIKELVRIGVIEDLRPGLGDDKSRLAAVRFLVKDFDEPLEDRVWIDRSLVEYFNPKSKQSNLDRLCEMGPLCIRVLLWMYANQPVNSTTVQHPIPSECIPGMMNRYRWDEDQNRTLDSHEIRLACYPEFVLLGCDLVQWFKYTAIVKAIDKLYQEGFIYEVIMVWDEPLQVIMEDGNEMPFMSVDAQPQYQLHVRRCNGETSDDEVGVSHLTLKASKSADVSVVPHDGNLENQFVVISKPGQNVVVAGVYRLSNRVTNTHYHHISEAWSSLMDSERAYRRWLAYTMEDEYGVDLKNLAQTKRCEAKTQKVLKRRAHSRRVVFRSGR